MNKDTLDIAKTIHSRRRELGLTLQELAKKTGLSQSTLQRYETGAISSIPLKRLHSLATALSLSPQDLMGWQQGSVPQAYPVEPCSIPLLGTIAAGEPIYAQESYETYIHSGTDFQADFALRVQGDSMIGARIFDGDIVFIRSQNMVENGEIAAVLIDDEATLKRFYREGNTVTLLAENPKYPPRVMRLDEFSQVRVLGLAVAFQSTL